MRRGVWKDLEIGFAIREGELTLDVCYHAEQLRARFEQNPEYRRQIESVIPMIGPVFKELFEECLDENSKRNEPTPTRAMDGDSRAPEEKGQPEKLLDRQVAEDGDTIH